MQNIRLLFIFLLLATGLISKAQDNPTILEYINTYKQLAISEEMRTGVPAAIKLAQGIHETTAGTSELVLKSNNHFGIKCKSNWTGESVTHDDDARGECFRKYDDPADSYRDHSDFLKNNTRYASLFQLDPLDYKDWAYGLKKAGYATNPKYPLIIIKLIEDYDLQDYTLIALGKKEPGDIILAKNDDTKKDQPEVIAKPAVVREIPDYPSGEFRINETRVIYAKKSTSFLSIAEEYHVPLARLFEYNELQQSEEVQNDQLIYLQRKRKTGAHEFHIVKQGETLADIASIEGIRMESLLELNYLSPKASPAIGEQLYLHKKAPGAPRLDGRVVANRGTIE